ncbi:MAG: hypothetical protein QOC98_1594 [Frankiaceae bacterium]|nr:hypothetical protein [Frankiaceae bacterium]
MGFAGFPEEMLTFYEGLEADNSKPYWNDHREQYERAVATPMRALLDALGPEFGEAKFFRPYRDVRFSKDKTPYKTAAGAVVRGEPGEGGLYVQVSADGMLVAGGYWSCATDQSRRLREAVADDRLGGQLVTLLGELSGAGFEVGGERLKRVPKPAPADHPRADLLRAKTLTASRHHLPDDGLHSPLALKRVQEGWRALAPLNRWLADHVGVSRAVPVR